jgi:DNA modification methylase
MNPYYQTPDGKVTLYHGHVLDVLREMPAESVNCVVTSPPYWSLRKYDCEPVIWSGDSECEHEWGDPLPGDNRGGSGPGAKEGYAPYARDAARGATCRLCGAFFGQYGLEPTPELYVEHTLMWLREVRRVLRKDGTLWLNIGDGYASSPAKGGSGPGAKEGYHGDYGRPFRPGAGRTDGIVDPRAQRNRDGIPCPDGLKPKDAVLMPFRVALAAQADGWWIRSVIIWAKPNPMPESVRDRPTDAHEYIFLLTKSKTYWYDQDAVREKSGEECRRAASFRDGGTYTGNRAFNPDDDKHKDTHGDGPSDNGRNCRSVWTFPTEPYPDAHFAVFPRELPERCIKAGAPPDGIVLDPFAGSGTTCEVAYHLGRTAIGIDASAKYLDMAIERVKQGLLL